MRGLAPLLAPLCAIAIAALGACGESRARDDAAARPPQPTVATAPTAAPTAAAPADADVTGTEVALRVLGMT